MNTLFRQFAKIVDVRLNRNEFVATMEKYTQASDAAKAKMLFSVSTKLSRIISRSLEFILGFVVLGIFFGVTLPFGTDAAENRFRAHVLWIAGTAIFYVFVRYTLPFAIALRLTKLNIASFFASVALFYSITAQLFIWFMASLMVDTSQFGFIQSFIFMTMFISTLVAATLIRNARNSILIDDKASGEAQLVARIPHHIRGQLIMFHTNDHYLDVTTTQGSALVRLSLQEAITLVGEDEGVRVHRSYWVSKWAMRSSKLHTNRKSLKLENGVEIPVAKNRVNEVIGWLSDTV